MRKSRTFVVLAITAVLLASCSADYYADPNQQGSQQPFAPPPATSPLPNAEPYDAVYFDNPGVNPFIDTEDDELSTFALDVDTGSYTVARRFVADGYLPDKDSVRVEEFVNYFEQDYRIPTEEEALSLAIDGGSTPFVQNPKNRVVRIGIQAAAVDRDERRDANLVFVVDTSGSMGREDRLGLVKRSLELLVGSLSPTDTVGIVAYGSRAYGVLPPTPVSDEGEILRGIDSLRSDGSTNAAEGLAIGYDMARQAFRDEGINRVILASDGVANAGSATDAEGILQLIEADAERGIELVTVGFGMGNYNDVLMEQLADRGDGFYAYVDTLDEARRIFVEDLTGTLQTMAKEARVQVEFDADAVQSWRLIGFENRALADEDFQNDSVDAGELGAGHTVTALYEIKVVAENDNRLGMVRLRWIDPLTGTAREIEQAIEGSAVANEFAQTAPRFQQDVVVAQYAEILRESIWATQLDADLGELAILARQLGGPLGGDPDVMEFIALVEKSSTLD